MKTMMLMRHAKSSWAEAGIEDFDRELNQRGRKAAPRVGDWMKENNLLPDHILASTALRAKQTTELVVEHSGFRGDVQWEPDLYLAPASVLLSMIAKVDDRFERVLVVAHNPGMEHLVSTLLNRLEAFPTAALAIFESDIVRWSSASELTSWKCTQFVLPREL